MRHAIEFHSENMTEQRFGAMLRRLAEEVAQTDDRQLVVKGRRADGEYAAEALPVPMGSYLTPPRRVPDGERNDLVAALFRYYVGVEHL
jgi:hypothetical protein